MPTTPTLAGSRTGLSVFRDPSSVAVVGASADRSKWGYWLARGALVGAGRRTVHLVNHRAGQLLGQPTVPTVAGCEPPPELVALSVPASQVGGVVDEALELGARGFVAVTAGVPDEAALAARVRAAGGRMIGPNSLGLFDATTALHLAWGDFTPGHLAVVSQSGQLGTEIAGLAARSGVGVSRFVSIGNQADVTAAELLADLADHDDTRVVALYLESFAGGPELVEAMRVLVESGKPVLLMTIGASAASQRAARSHTGSMTSPLDAVDAACAAAGALRVQSPSQLVEVAALLSAGRPLRGRRVAVVGDSGGQGALAADVLAGQGLHLPQLSAGVAAELGGGLPPQAAVANPVDLAGGGEQDLRTYARTVTTLLGCGEVDGVVLTGYFGRYALDVPEVADREFEVASALGTAAATTGIPLVVHTMGADSPTTALLRERGVPAYEDIDGAARALGAAATLGELSPRPVPRPASCTATPVPDHWAARTLLESSGLAFPRGRPVSSPVEVAAAAAELTAPYVLKAAWLEHKTEHGGVRVGLADPAAAVAAFEQLRSRLGDGSYLLEEQDCRPGVVELIVGARQVPGIGPVVLVGAGGVQAELHRDVAVELAPVTADVAAAMLGRLRCRPLLEGWRGAPGVDLDRVARAVAAVSELAATRPDLVEVEVNPLRAGADGALAVDVVAIQNACSATTFEHQPTEPRRGP